MDLKCRYETRTKKDGSKYQVIVIYITDNTTKMVFPDSAEKELLNILSQQKSSNKIN